MLAIRAGSRPRLPVRQFLLNNAGSEAGHVAGRCQGVEIISQIKKRFQHFCVSQNIHALSLYQFHLTVCEQLRRRNETTAGFLCTFGGDADAAVAIGKYDQ